MSESAVTLKELVNNFLIEAVGVTPEKLEDPTLNFEQLGLDSLGAAELLYEVEDKFGITVEDVSGLKTMTLGASYVFFQQLLDEKEAKQSAAALPAGALA